MGFVKKLFSAPEVQQVIAPVEDVPSYDDEQRELEERRKLLEAERKRVGRRKTILTGGQGLNDIEDKDIDKKTLLGG